MKKKAMITLKLEALVSSDSGQLIGGFSPVVTQPGTPGGSGIEKNKDCMTTNNCSGANCRLGCGNS